MLSPSHHHLSTELYNLRLWKESPVCGKQYKWRYGQYIIMSLLWRYVEHTSCNHTDPTTVIRIVTSRIIWGQIIVWRWYKSRERKNALLHADIPFHFGYVMCYCWWWWHWRGNICLSQVNKRHHRPLCQKHTLLGMASTEYDTIISRVLPRSCSRTLIWRMKVDEKCWDDHQELCSQQVQGNGYMHCRHSKGYNT